jgi:hypothetical protein
VWQATSIPLTIPELGIEQPESGAQRERLRHAGGQFGLAALVIRDLGMFSSVWAPVIGALLSGHLLAEAEARQQVTVRR